MKRSLRVLSVALALMIGACAIGGHPPSAPPRHTALGLKISRFELSNGLRVVVVEDPRAAEVQVTMRYQVGSVDDPPGQEGVAHLVEHLNYQQVLGGKSVFAHLEDNATDFSGSTTFDATTYMSRAPATHLDELLSIEAVRVGSHCTSVTDSAFTREREVVVSELRFRDASAEVLAAVHRGLYPEGHPYRRMPGGSEDGVRAITREQACAFADAHYAPQNAVLVVSGDITAQQVETALGKFLIHIAKRDVAAPKAVVPVPPIARHVETPAPIDEDALLVAWPLPEDPQLRTNLRALLPEMQRLVDNEIKGEVSKIEEGDERAPMVGIVVVPGKTESIADVTEGVKAGLQHLPDSFNELSTSTVAEVAFDRMKQTAIYELFANLEDGGSRDQRLATFLLAGRDPSEALGSQFQGLRAMTGATVSTLAREHFSFDRATVVVLKTTGTKKTGRELTLEPAIHDLGQHRDPPDPAIAHHPLSGDLAAREFAGMQTRVLPNGLKIVLLPLTSVPTIDIRLVFGSGTGDEATGKRGAALVAGYALRWDFRYLNDLIPYAAAGGSDLVEVHTDHTTFRARGLDMHLDLLLAGLRRWVRDGRYDEGADNVVEAMQRTTKHSSDDQALNDAWRRAVFGADHPYVKAGLMHHASRDLTSDDAVRFREAHFTPDNATLVIAGRFDPALADQWIDYLFSDWNGRAQPRSSPPPAPTPASIAKVSDTEQAWFQISIPATADTRARQLVMAAMLSEIVRDVRHQLGASYAIDARLAESRLATQYVIAGWFEASRSHDVVELLRSRIENLRNDEDVAARAFVSARSRVLSHLLSVVGNASLLAQRVEQDVDLVRAPMSDRQTALAVQALTIEDMAPALADLDLRRAAVLMRGPEPEVESAFAVLHRKPTYIHVGSSDDEEPGTAAAGTRRSRDPLYYSDLSDSLTAQSTPRTFTLSVAGGYTTGTWGDYDATGGSLAGNFGFQFERGDTGGLHLAISELGGSFMTGMATPVVHSFVLTAFDVSGYVQATAIDRLWGGAFAGIHVDRMSEKATVWNADLGLGLEGGVDILKHNGQRFGVYGRLQAELLTEARNPMLTFGLAYRK